MLCPQSTAGHYCSPNRKFLAISKLLKELSISDREFCLKTKHLLQFCIYLSIYLSISQRFRLTVASANAEHNHRLRSALILLESYFPKIFHIHATRKAQNHSTHIPMAQNLITTFTCTFVLVNAELNSKPA